MREWVEKKLFRKLIAVKFWRISVLELCGSGFIKGVLMVKNFQEGASFTWGILMQA